MPAPDYRYDLVLLDVGGTMLGFHERAPFQEFLGAMGLSATDEDARELHRRFVAVMVSTRDSAGGLGAQEAPLFDWWHGVFQKTWPGRPDLAEEMYRWFRQSRFDRVFADTVPALEALRTLGLRLAVLSNFGLNLEALLQRWKLREYFEFVVVSAAIGLAKPDPRIFDRAVERAGLPRDRMLYVGDHFGDDVMGARAAGMAAVLVDRPNRHADLPCARIASLIELPQFIRLPAANRQAILFDMDGVILDSMPAHLRSWQQTLAPLGISLTAAELYPTEGMPTEATAKLLTERFLGRACSDEEARRLTAAKRALFLRDFSPTFIPGIVPLLYDLRGRGHRLALVTGGARGTVEPVLRPSGVLDLFEQSVTGTDVSRGKPDPEPYRAALSRLGLQPGQCLAVENSPLGIRAAKSAGLECVALETSLPADRLSGADRVFPDVAALRSWLLGPGAAGSLSDARG
jgi:beta-phosphoglucomutase